MTKERYEANNRVDINVRYNVEKFLKYRLNVRKIVIENCIQVLKVN